MPAVKRKRKFPKVSKSRKGVPKAYLKGAKNPKAREREILRTRKKYKSGKMTKKIMKRLNVQGLKIDLNVR